MTTPFEHDLGMVRVCALSLDDPVVRLSPPTAAESAEWLARVRARSDVLEAIADAAPALASSLARWEELTPSRQRKVTRSVWRYVNRMAHRPTPCGLLSRLGLIRFDDGDQTRLHPEALTHDVPPRAPVPEDHSLLVTSPWIERGPDGVAWLPRPGQPRDLSDHLTRLDTTPLIDDLLVLAATPSTRVDLLDKACRRHPSADATRLARVLDTLERLHVLVAAHEQAHEERDSDGIAAVNLGPARSRTAAAEAVEALARCTLPEPYPVELRDYARDFTERYGRDAEVGVLEVTSALHGLGVSAPVPPRPLHACPDDLPPMLGALLHLAQSSGVTYVEPSADWLARMQVLRDASTDGRRQRSSVDVTLSERTDARWVPGSASGFVLERTGLNRTGQMGARFLHHFSAGLADLYIRSARTTPTHADEPRPVTLDYDLAPEHSSYQQLVARAAPGDTVLDLRTGSPRAGTVLDLEDLVLGVDRHGILRLRSCSTDELVDVSHRSMVRYGLAPHLARMLMEVSEHQYSRTGDFFLGHLARFPFFPGIHLGPYLLSRPRWYVDPANVGSAAALRTWLEAMRVPRIVSARTLRSDQYLIIDLETQEGLEEAHALLRSGPLGLVLEDEALGAPPCDAGQFRSEIVVTVHRVPQDVRPQVRELTAPPPPAGSSAREFPDLVLDLSMPARSVDAFLRHDYPHLLESLPEGAEPWWTRRRGPVPGLRIHLPSTEHGTASAVVARWQAGVRLTRYACATSRPALTPSDRAARVTSSRLALDHVRGSASSRGQSWLVACLSEMRCAAEGMLSTDELRALLVTQVADLPPATGGAFFRDVRAQLDDSVAPRLDRTSRRAMDSYAASLRSAWGAGSRLHLRAVTRLLAAHADRIGLSGADAELVLGAWLRWARSEDARSQVARSSTEVRAG